MEGWHFEDIDDLSPLTAYSLATSRWGLEPLPRNIALGNATFEYLLSQNSDSLAVWEFLDDDCTPSTTNRRGAEASDYYEISRNTTFCSKPQRCGQSNCTNLIEGFGRITTGPTGAGIVGLAHGISILIVIISTVMMGWFTKKLDKREAKSPPRPRGLEANDMRSHYHHPPQPNNPPVPIPIRAPPDEKKSKEISHCIDLLRQMYDLELQITSARDNIYSTERTDNRWRERADALRNEIQHIANEWKAMPLGYFTTEERGFVEDICTAINTYQRGGR